MTRKRLSASLGLLTAAALALAACANSTPAPTAAPAPEGATAPAATSAPVPGATSAPAQEATAAPSGGSVEQSATYRVGIFEDLSTINYWSYLGPNSSVWNAYVLQPQRLGLYTLTDATREIVPQLATEMPERPLAKEGDFYVATIPMLQDVRWSDGTPLTAKDAAFTINTVVELKLPGNWGTTYDPAFIERAEAADDYTLKIFYKREPGLAVHEWNALQGPILSEAYWAPVVEEAKAAVGALSAPAEDAPQEQKDAYDAKLAEALNVLFNHVPDGEPLAGAFTQGKWEQGAFVENTTNPDYYATGAEIGVYANGAYQEIKAGEGGYELKVGDPASERLVSYQQGPHVASTIYTVYGSQDAAILALKNGEIDYILNSLGLQRGLRGQVEGQEGVNVIENPVNGFRYLAFNTTRKPMDNTFFRQAVATLIDKNFVTTQILQGAAMPTDTFVPPGNKFWYSNDVTRWGVKDDGTAMSREERVNKAIEILEAGGYSFEGGVKPSWDADNQQVVRGGTLLLPDGTPMQELELLAPGPAYDPLRSTFSLWIEQWLNEFGIPVRANPTGFNVIIEKVRQQQDFDMYMLGWSLTIFPDYLRDFLHSDRGGLGDFNSGRYSNPKFDKLSDTLKTCKTLDECKAIADQTQRLLSEELPYVILFDTGIIEAYRSDTLTFPYTETLDGLQTVYGLPNAVLVAE